MKPILASALGFILASTAWGQHGGAGHTGGSFGHATGSFSSAGSYSMSASGSSRALGSTSGYRSNWSAPQYNPRYSSPTGGAPFGGSYPYGERPYRNSYNYGYRPLYSRGVYLVPGYLGGFYDYGYPADYSDQQAAAVVQQPAPQEDAGYVEPQPLYPPATRPQYQPEAPAANIPDQPEVTVLFKDGRPAQQIQNYAVTPTTLYVLDGARRREIPLDEIDLPQTEKTNRDAGVDFEVPVSPGN